VKEPGLGPSVAWHQDGTTHWTAADWDHGAHGFNFMTQLYPSTAAKRRLGAARQPQARQGDIRKMVAESGSDRIDGAVPMLCEAGDTIVTNRQLVHGSFAKQLARRRLTLNAGFFPRKRVLNITTRRLTAWSRPTTKSASMRARASSRSPSMRAASASRRRPLTSTGRSPPRGREPVERDDPRHRAEEL